MRILLLNQFYTPDVAATGQLMADLAGALVRRGHEVHVLCSRRTYGGGAVSYPPEEVLDGVQVHRVAATGLGRGNLLLCSVDYASFYVLAAARAMSLGRMDVCVGLNTPPYIGLIGLLLKKRRRTPLVLWMMDVFPELALACDVLKRDSLPHRFFAALSKALYRQASRVISLGDVMSRVLIDGGADPRTLVPVHNWVPGEGVRPMDAGGSRMRRDCGAGDDVTLMYSGNMGRGHGLQTIVRAAARLGRDVPLHLLFVGKGRMRKPLRKLAEALGLKRITFRDPCPLAELSDSLAAGDVHLVGQKPGTQGVQVPSKTYGILAAGRPILFVGPEDCEVAHIVRDSGAGVVVPPGDVDGTAAALRTLVEDAAGREQMARRARRYYATRLGRARSVRRIIGEIEAVGRSAAGGPGRIQPSPRLLVSPPGRAPTRVA